MTLKQHYVLRFCDVGSLMDNESMLFLVEPSGEHGMVEDKSFDDRAHIAPLRNYSSNTSSSLVTNVALLIASLAVIGQGLMTSTLA